MAAFLEADARLAGVKPPQTVEKSTAWLYDMNRHIGSTQEAGVARDWQTATIPVNLYISSLNSHAPACLQSWMSCCQSFRLRVAPEAGMRRSDMQKLQLTAWYHI